MLAELIDRLVAPLVDPAESIVVAGVWRSGTTWVQASVAEMVGAKSVFEPLTPNFAPVLPLYDQLAPPGTPVEDAQYVPYDFSAPLRDWVEASLRGTTPGKGVRRLRVGFGNAFRRRVVIKCTRGHLVVPDIQRTFGTPVLHVLRDLRCVIASLKRAGWIHWFRGPCLKQHFLRIPDGRIDHFAAFDSLIREMDDRGRVCRAATYVGLLDRYLLDNLKGRRVVRLVYENVVQEGEGRLHRALRSVGITDVGTAGSIFHRDSVTTGQAGRTREDRVRGWRDDLSSEEVDIVDEVIERTGLRDRDPAER